MHNTSVMNINIMAACAANCEFINVFLVTWVSFGCLRDGFNPLWGALGWIMVSFRIWMRIGGHFPSRWGSVRNLRTESSFLGPHMSALDVSRSKLGSENVGCEHKPLRTFSQFPLCLFVFRLFVFSALCGDG